MRDRARHERARRAAERRCRNADRGRGGDRQRQPRAARARGRLSARMVRSSRARAHAPGRGFADRGAGAADARQRDARRAADSVFRAGERRAHRAARSRAAIPDAHPPPGARACGERAARRRPAQGRVPGDARARAAQSAGASVQRGGGAADVRLHRSDRTRRPRDAGAADPRAGAPGRRPARRRAHHARQGGAAPRAGRTRAHRRQRRGDEPSAHGDAPVIA